MSNKACRHGGTKLWHGGGNKNTWIFWHVCIVHIADCRGTDTWYIDSYVFRWTFKVYKRVVEEGCKKVDTKEIIKLLQPTVRRLLVRKAVLFCLRLLFFFIKRVIFEMAESTLAPNMARWPYGLTGKDLFVSLREIRNPGVFTGLKFGMRMHMNNFSKMEK